MAESLVPPIDVATVAEFVVSVLSSACIPAHQMRVKRVADGVSTIVYRIYAGDHKYYLRIPPDPDMNLAAETTVHQKLTALGLHIPHVLHFEPHHPVWQRSVLLTTEVPGRAIGYTHPPAQVDTILQQAGRELAQINQIPVQGFGWANRVTATSGEIVAEYASPTFWLQAHFAAPIRAIAQCDVLSNQDVERLLILLDRAKTEFANEPPVLAHGDFDVTHIYSQHCTYTGIIDFGEIRGAHWLYDLSHFAIESPNLLPYLLTGYQEVKPLNPIDIERLNLTSLLIAARRIGHRALQSRSPHQPDAIHVVQSIKSFKQK